MEQQSGDLAKSEAEADTKAFDAAVKKLPVKTTRRKKP
jgi:hypothetical protein